MSMPIPRLLRELAATAPDLPAVTCGDRRVSRRELEERSNRLARAYAQLGVDQDAFVTIALPNGIEFLEATIAAWKLGAVPAPVSSRLPDRERAAIIELADPALVVGVDGGALGARACVPPGFEPDPSYSDEAIEPDRVAPSWKAPTSGGSTGTPKIIVAGQPAEMEPMAGTVYGMTENGTVLVPGPLYHNAPFAFAVLALFTGSHVVVLPKFDAVAALEAIQAHHVDWACLVPTMMLRIWRVLEEHPGAHDISSLRMVWHGAAPCPAWLKEAWIELVGAEHIIETYGGTEGTAVTVITGDEWLEHRGSVGRPAIGEMKILDADGKELPPGEVGEIYMRGPDGAPPAYRYIGAAVRVRDGWESIGDLGCMDEDGYLYISDRRTDMIVAGGANIYPAEVEAALLEHPLVQSAVVVGLPDDDLGQRVHAVVQSTSGLTGDDLAEFLGERLVRYKIPRSFRFVDEALRDDAGKVRRGALRDQEVAVLESARAGS